MAIEYAMRKKVYDLPVKLVTVDQFREMLNLFGEKIMVILHPVSGGGFVFRAEPIYQPSKAFELRSERHKRRRVFKTVEAALHVARDFGFSSVQIELEPVTYPQAFE